MASHFPGEQRPIGLTGCGFPPGDFPPPAEKSPPLSILVVDDEPLIRWWLSETLADSGHRIVEAADGSEAVEAATRAPLPFDVVLLDFRLPDSNDLSLLSRLRQLAPHARIIMMTAYGTPEMMEGALHRGADHVLTKPFEIADVARLVQTSDVPHC